MRTVARQTYYPETCSGTGPDTNANSVSAFSSGGEFMSNCIASDPDHDYQKWPIFIRLLGEFQLLIFGELVPVHSTKIEALLANLALEKDFQLSRDTLLHRLWPDYDRRLAGQSLNSLLYKLRRLFSETAWSSDSILVMDNGSYGLNRAIGIEVDVRLFEELTRRASSEEETGNHSSSACARRQAVALYRGDLSYVLETTVEGSLTSQREHLRLVYLDTIEQLARYHYLQAEYNECLELAELLLENDPCRETAHRTIMCCQVLTGQRSRAFRQYSLCKELLHGELGAVPEHATVALFDRIRNDPDSVYSEDPDALALFPNGRTIGAKRHITPHIGGVSEMHSGFR